MDNLQFVNEIIKTKGNCNDLECNHCPINKDCKRSAETKQTTLTRAHYFKAGILGAKAR